MKCCVVEKRKGSVELMEWVCVGFYMCEKGYVT